MARNHQTVFLLIQNYVKSLTLKSMSITFFVFDKIVCFLGLAESFCQAFGEKNDQNQVWWPQNEVYIKVHDLHSSERD